MSELHDHVLNDWGIDISNIRIESLRIADKHLAASIANQAIQVSELEAKHMMLEKETEIIQVEATNRAKELLIRTDAESDAVRSTSKAKAESIIYEAEAESKAIVLKAEAEKGAKILRGEGEQSYSQALTGSKLGAELARLDMHVKAMKTCKQVCYVPHLPAMLSKGNPLFDASLAIPEI